MRVEAYIGVVGAMPGFNDTPRPESKRDVGQKAVFGPQRCGWLES